MRLLFSHPSATILAGLGLCFLVSWVFVYRFKHPYLGFLALALFVGGAKSLRDWGGAAEAALFAVCFASAASTVALMVRESVQNVQRVRAEHARRREEFVRQVLAEAQGKAGARENQRKAAEDAASDR